VVSSLLQQRSLLLAWTLTLGVALGVFVAWWLPWLFSGEG
jgi:hypothetical protein